MMEKNLSIEVFFHYIYIFFWIKRINHYAPSDQTNMQQTFKCKKTKKQINKWTGT